MLKRSALALLAAAVPLGCHKRTDAQTRKAWEDAMHDDSPKTRARRGTPGKADEGQSGAKPALQGWARVEQVVGRAADVLTVAGDAETLERLAKKWCEVAPEPRMTKNGSVRVCHPDPPVLAGGHNFTLELGDAGVIGLVATDLTLAEARALSAEARQATRRWCTRAWTAVTTAKASQEEFHTCPFEAGPTLAVGHLPAHKGSNANAWQVSIAVLGAG